MIAFKLLNLHRLRLCALCFSILKVTFTKVFLFYSVFVVTTIAKPGETIFTLTTFYMFSIGFNNNIFKTLNVNTLKWEKQCCFSLEQRGFYINIIFDSK